MLLELLEDKLKNHQIASPTGSSTQPVAISSNDKPSTGRPSPTVSRTSSLENHHLEPRQSRLDQIQCHQQIYQDLLQTPTLSTTCLDSLC